jgi:hypothetical protein
MRCRRRDPGHPEHQAPSGVWIATVTAWNSTDQAAKLAWVAKTSPRLHRAYLLMLGKLPWFGAVESLPVAK